jgi:hypothetical protein
MFVQVSTANVFALYVTRKQINYEKKKKLTAFPEG